MQEQITSEHKCDHCGAPIEDPEVSICKSCIEEQIAQYSNN